MIGFVDVTDLPRGDPLFPDWLAQFDKMGFSEVGRVLATTGDPDRDEAMALNWGPQHEAACRRALETPTPVLAPADQSALVDISWMWGPSVRIFTALGDGSLVETQRRWDRVPPLPTSVARRFVPAPLDAEMTRGEASGRSMELVSTDSAVELWDRHRAHVSRIAATRNSKPIEHRSLDLYCSLVDQALRHKSSCGLTSRRGLTAIGLVALLTFAVALQRPVWPSDSTNLVPFLAVCIAGVTTWLFWSRVFPRLLHLQLPRFLRPRFRFDPASDVPVVG